MNLTFADDQDDDLVTQPDISLLQSCMECGADVDVLFGAPDGAQLCQQCNDAAPC